MLFADANQDFMDQTVPAELAQVIVMAMARVTIKLVNASAPMILLALIAVNRHAQITAVTMVYAIKIPSATATHLLWGPIAVKKRVPLVKMALSAVELGDVVMMDTASARLVALDTPVRENTA